ncbi:hypothetical protein K4F52_001454 [Lecanicillium sp. MT-2017a]|nr:hypothetical protein K4F52_001454 [Lecanicillium sp. MT-2017a]
MRRQLLQLRSAQPSATTRLAPSTTARRAFTTTSSIQQQDTTNGGARSNSRWLGDLRKRMHQCMSRENLPPKHAAELRERMSYLDKNWLELSAGREGYLADAKWRGVDKQSVAWGHVNNVLYNRYAESGRVGWVMNLANNSDAQYREQISELMTPRGIGLILASIKTDFKFPMTYPDQVTVMHKLITKPDASSDRLLFEAVAYSHRHQRPAAKFIEDVAVYDYKAGKKAPLRQFMVELMDEVFDMQKQRQAAAELEIEGLHQFVEGLEG